jgi:hypothetical protein
MALDSRRGRQQQPTPPLTGRGSAPIFPNPSTNPAILILQARERVAEAAAAEFATGRGKDRKFIDAITLRRVLHFRNVKGWEDSKIEKELGLKPGLVSRLGPKGVFGGVGEGDEFDPFVMSA